MAQQKTEKRKTPRKQSRKSVKSTGSIQVLSQEIKSPLSLYQYQKDWINDRSRLKIGVKSRRIGFSFGDGLENVLGCLEQRQNSIVLSRGQRQAKEFISESAAPHCQAIGAVSEYITDYIPKTSILKHEIRFSNGSRIIALPANPDTARSYEGDVTLDEFAFHKDAKGIYTSITPSITRGFRLKIISTTNGQQGAYFDLATEAGLVDGHATSNRFSSHNVDIFKAVAEGFSDRFGNVIDPAVIRMDCLDEDMWLQEYCCHFLSIASQWIPPALFQRNVDPEMGAEIVFEIGVMPIQDFAGRELYGGWDIARSKDLSVIWIFEKVGDVFVTVGVIQMAKIPTPDQKAEAFRIIPYLRRMVFDKSGMGLSIFEDCERKFGPMVEGVQFTMGTKEALAVGIKSTMENTRTRLPDTATIRHSFRSVKKISTATGQARFDAEHDAQHGHADHFWAAALCLSGALAPGHGLLDYWKEQAESLRAQQASSVKTTPEGVALQLAEAQKMASSEDGFKSITDMNKIRSASNLIKPAVNDQTPFCPECKNINLTRSHKHIKCGACGWSKRIEEVSKSDRL